MSASYGSNDSASVNDISRISAGSVIKGEITSPNDIRIDGTFEGRIFSQAKVVVGECVEFGGLFGYAPVMPVSPYSAEEFIARGGRIPAPLQSLKN